MTGLGTSRGVVPTARVLVGAATATLPSGAGRERYHLEHLAELHALPRGDQVRYALGALATSWALRRALTPEAEMSTIPTPSAVPLLCRLRLHHHWRTEHNEAGEAYRRCTRCGKDATGDPPRGTPKHPLPYG